MPAPKPVKTAVVPSFTLPFSTLSTKANGIEAADDKAINEFDRLSLISNDILRHLITKIEK